MAGRGQSAAAGNNIEHDQWQTRTIGGGPFGAACGSGYRHPTRIRVWHGMPMDTIRSLVFLALAMLAMPAVAQTVHRCKVGDTVAYQDRPCADAASDAGTLTIRTSAPGKTPKAVQELLDKAAKDREWREWQAARQPPPVEPEPAPVPQRKGYRCTAGSGANELVTYSYEPCPPTMITFESRSYDSHWVERRATTQEEVSARTVCEAEREAQGPYVQNTTSNPCKHMPR
jgi:hypothetical protein